jgi:hypothetical protein
MAELSLPNSDTQSGQSTYLWGTDTDQNSPPFRSGADEAAAKSLLIQLFSGELPDKDAVQKAVGDIVSPGRSATDAEVRDLLARFSVMLKALGPGADEYVRKLIESYDQLPEYASAPLW